MANGIRFKELLVANTEQNKSIEDNAKTLFSYASIHDHSFDNELNETWAGGIATGTWTATPATAVWTAIPESEQVQGVGDGGSAWDYLLSVDDVPPEGVLSVYRNGNRGGIIFRGTDSSDHYLFYWDTDSVGFKKCSSGSYSTLIDIPKTYTGEADLVISWREMKFRLTADEKWLFMSAWVDGELACTTEDDISGSTPGKKVGFAVYDTDTVTFGSVRIPELTEVIEWASVDVGEAPGSGLSRMIGRRHINYYLRYDGTLRMWRPKSATSSYTYDGHITGFSWSVDLRNLVGHWRQVGAWEEADRFDTDLIQRGITRFHKDNNPDLMNKEACYDEAGYSLQEIKENSDRIDMSVPAQVLQEPEDVVTIYFERDDTIVINSLDYIIDLDSGYTVSFQGGKLSSDLRLRKAQ